MHPVHYAAARHAASHRGRAVWVALALVLLALAAVTLAKSPDAKAAQSAKELRVEVTLTRPDGSQTVYKTPATDAFGAGTYTVSAPATITAKERTGCFGHWQIDVSDSETLTSADNPYTVVAPITVIATIRTFYGPCS